MTDTHVRRHMLAKITARRGNDYEFFQRLVYVIVKEVPRVATCELVFDLYAEIDTLDSLAFAELATSFGLPQSTNKPLTRAQFMFTVEGVDFAVLQQAQGTFSALTAVLPEEARHADEQASIMAFLGKPATGRRLSIDWESEVMSRLRDEDSFYVVEKAFWDEWTLVTDEFAPRKKIRRIDNARLLEPGHSVRMKPLQCGDDYVLLPKIIFDALSTWYECTAVIERRVDRQLIRSVLSPMSYASRMSRGSRRRKSTKIGLEMREAGSPHLSHARQQ